jgi:hypothetical protein
MRFWQWFWERTLWEIENQPVLWGCFVTVVVALFAGAAMLIVFATGIRRRSKEADQDTA